MQAVLETQSSPTATELDERDLRIATAQARAVGIMQSDPGRARSISTTTGTVRAGLACEIEQGRHQVVADLGPGVGGDKAGPSPSFYARAAIASCVAIAIKMHAANEGHTFREVVVSVTTDMYDLALWGIGPYGAAPVATEILIMISTDSSPESVQAIVDTALDRDPWFLALRDKQAVGAEVMIA